MKPSFYLQSLSITFSGCVLLSLITGVAVGQSSPEVIASSSDSQRQTELVLQNRPARLEWLQDAGFGLFVHWSLDSQVGSVISHSLVGASEEYSEWFFNELPKTFNPHRWNPDELAVLAKLSGAKYVVFTAKHHSGFCMWDTKTTPFNIMNTPYSRGRSEKLR